MVVFVIFISQGDKEKTETSFNRGENSLFTWVKNLKNWIQPPLYRFLLIACMYQAFELFNITLSNISTTVTDVVLKTKTSSISAKDIY